MFLFSKAYKTPVSTYTDSYRPPCSVKKAQKNYRLEPLWRENKFVTQVNATQGGNLRVSTLGSCRCLMPGKVVAWGLMGCLAACVQWGGGCATRSGKCLTPHSLCSLSCPRSCTLQCCGLSGWAISSTSSRKSALPVSRFQSVQRDGSAEEGETEASSRA